jgi:hypothetical protein
LLRNYVGGELHIEHVQGHNFPNDLLTDWDLVIHCGACMWNRREILSRMMHCRSAGVPITNYGLAIAFVHGILDRAVAVLHGGTASTGYFTPIPPARGKQSSFGGSR